ncbi:MAG: DUF3015 domain-containing protein [Candidatus Binatia bacterium]
MRKRQWLWLGVVLLPLCATQAWAQNADTGPGCGLGKLAWASSKNQKGIAPQVLQSTTNGTFASQTFGISFGTSGCTNDGTIWAQYKVPVFIAANYESLSQDMAQGGGEHLASLAELMGIPENDRPEFFSLAQVQYAALMESGNTTPEGMIQTLKSAMTAHPSFANL